MRKDQQIIQSPRPRGRWLFIILSVTLCSAAAADGWNCRATADGRWVCNASPPDSTAPSPPSADGPPEPRLSDDVPPQEKDIRAAPVIEQSLPEPSDTPPPPPVDEPPPSIDSRRESGSSDLKPAEIAATPGAASSALDVKETRVETVTEDELPDQPDQATREPPPDGDLASTPLPATAAEPDVSQPLSVDATPAEPAQPVVAASPDPAAPTTTLSTAHDLDKDIDWNQCGPLRGTTGYLTTPRESSQAPTPTVIEVEADAAELDRGSDSALLTGDVNFVYGKQTLDADQVLYNRSGGRVTAEGNVLLQRPDARLAGERLEMQLDNNTGSLSNAEYRVPAISARGTARHAEFGSDRVSRYQDITYTTCRPDNNDWLLRADALELDHTEGLGTAHSAKLDFLGVPIAYLPRFTFPIDDRRRSGVLVPSVGYSTNSGGDISVPYYLNLAPNYDLTLVPRVMSKRGIALGGEFRFLTQTHQGIAAAEIVPHDREYQDGKTRGSASLATHSEWGRRLEGDVQLDYASDSDYLEDLGDSLALTSTRQLERTGELNYYGDTWRVLGRVQHYQTLDQDIDAADSPYARLPQLRFVLQRPDGIGGLTYNLDSEYVYFEKEGGVDGHRIDINPGISLPLRRPWGYLEPKLAARYTRYDLDDLSLTLFTDDAPDRTVGIFSLDSGLYFDRQTSLFGVDTRQTLEPRLYYLNVPYTDQDDIPIFDTTALDFGFDNLFRENRFNGTDRYGDANQLTVALQSRTLSNATGEEIVKASLGQIYYFRDRKVTLPDEVRDEDNSSSVVGELMARLSPLWRVRGGVQWDPDDDFQQGLAQVNYSDGRDRVFNAAYRYRDSLLEQTDLAAIWPLSSTTSLIARWYYSLREDRTLEALAGIQYGRCCWRVRAVARQFTDSDTNDHNFAFMLQLELNGLGKLGNDIDSLLERGIYGYRIKDDN